MKNVRMIPRFSSLLLLVLLSCSLITGVHSSETAASLSDSEEASSISLSDPSLENPDWILAPGSTKVLLVQLKGNAEEIFFEFRSDEAESSTYIVSTIVNGTSVEAETKQFFQEEALAANLDYQAREVVLMGDNDFSISYPLQEELYQVSVSQERISDGDPIKQMIFISKKNSEPNTTVIIGAVGGSFGLVMVVITLGVLYRRRKSSMKPDLDVRCTDSAVLGQKLSTETLYTASAVTPMKGSELHNFKPGFEASAKLGLECKFKKDSSNSQASTLATITRFESQESNKSFLSANLKGLSEGENTDFGTITEVEDDQKHSPYVSVQSSQNKLLLLNNNKTILKSQELVVTKQNEKPFPPKRKSKSVLDIDIALDMDLDIDAGERRMPTLAEIKSLVRKMEEEGTIGNDCDPSEDTDEEDQYEAPPLPNYFCCMVCFEGKRCTVVEPCRHVFACNGCVKELLDTYKICVLCARPISSYEPL